MADPSENHDLARMDRGDTNWHQLYNSAIDDIDARLELRDTLANRPAASDVPAGTKFVVDAGDQQGAVFIEKDGSWEKQPVDTDVVHTDEAQHNQQVPVKVGILPDIHINPSDQTARRAELDAAVDDLNARGVDVVFQVGDFVTNFDGTTTSDYVSAIQTERDYLENQAGSNGNGLDAEVHYQLGNHEYKHVEDVDMGQVYDALGMGGTSLSDTCYTVDINGWRFVMLNSAYTTQNDVNGAKFARVPDSGDPFDALSWLDTVLDTDKYCVTITHYPLHNGPGDVYWPTGNGYYAAKKVAEGGAVTNVHGHMHGHNVYQAGAVKEDLFGNSYYTAGHITPERCTFSGNHPGDHMASWGDFWTPRDFELRPPVKRAEGLIGLTDRQGGSDSPAWGDVQLKSGISQTFDLSARGYAEDVSGSGAVSQSGANNRVRVSTGSTSGSHARATFTVSHLREVPYSVPEWFTTRAQLTTANGSDAETRICRGIPNVNGTTGSNRYGFFISHSGAIRGFTGRGGNSYEPTTNVIYDASVGEEVVLSAMLWSEDIVRFYVGSASEMADSNRRFETIETDTALANGDADSDKLATVAIWNGDAANYELDVYDWTFSKQGL